jgi:purine-cytosine permease-like protein
MTETNSRPPKGKWNLLHAAFYGLVVGGIMHMVATHGTPASAEMAGRIIGACLGMALLFVAVAAIRNYSAKTSN